jgi:hypothetical protein
MKEKTKVEIFLQKNMGMIISTARKRFPLNEVNSDEILSEAAIAYYEALSYMNRFKKAQMTSVFQWFLMKRFDRLARNNLLIPEVRPEIQMPVDADAGRCERMEFNDVADYMDIEEKVLRGGIYGNECKDDSESGFFFQRYHICEKSFEGIVARRTYTALKLLSRQGDFSEKRAMLCRSYSCSRLTDIIRRIQESLIAEVKEMGCRIFIGQCLNGSVSKILVCAVTKEEAIRYLREYGEILEIKEFQPT